jgi:hypothetical protein
VKVDLIQREDARHYFTFRVAAAGPAANPGTPAYEQAAASLRKALVAHGLREAVRSADVDLIVAIDYGTMPPRERKTTDNEPTIADALTVESLPYPQATLEPKKRTGRHPTRIKKSNVYKKYLVITATENAGFASRVGPAVQVWRLEATVENEDANLEPALPVMIRAAVDRMPEIARAHE